MSATIDPRALRAYFGAASVVSIPGRTNYPIEELFLEDLLPRLPPADPREARGAARPSPFAAGPLPGLPQSVEAVIDAWAGAGGGDGVVPPESRRRVRQLDQRTASQLALAHAADAEQLDLAP